MGLQSIEKQIGAMMKSKSTQNKIKNTNSAVLDDAMILKKTIELKSFIKKRIIIEIESIYVPRMLSALSYRKIKDGSGFEIYFDEIMGTQISLFPSYQKMGVGAFRPLLANEGYEIKNGMFAGMSQKPTYFIEKAIEDYKKQNKNINIKLIKKWTTRYTQTNKTIDSVKEY